MNTFALAQRRSSRQGFPAAATDCRLPGEGNRISRFRFRGAPIPAVAGFTLIEILVVVVILGVLASVVVINVIPRTGEARATKATADIATLRSALDNYKLDNFVYPTTAQGLQALVVRPSSQSEAPNWRGPYLRDAILPKDPWGRDYQYQSPGSRAEVDVYTFGSDGRPGGDGEAADIGNWTR